VNAVIKLVDSKIRLAKALNHLTFLMRCTSQGIIPKGLSKKIPVNSRRSSKIVQRASKSLLGDRIHFHWHNKTSQLQKIQQLEEFLKSFVTHSDQERIFTAVVSSFGDENLSSIKVGKFIG
jgi:hypothetical protein